MTKLSNTLCALLFTAVGFVSQANAGVIGFSFSNVDGPVLGEVSGTITLSGDGDGIFQATSIIVDSSPDPLGYTESYDVLANMTNVLENTFTISGGLVDVANSHFTAFIAPPPGNLGSAFSLNGTAFGPGSFMNVELSPSAFTGVLDTDSSTLVFSTVSPVPAPATLGLLVISLAGLGLTRVRKFS